MDIVLIERTTAIAKSRDTRNFESEVRAMHVRNDMQL